MNTIISINNMYKAFDGVIALQGMDFTINEGEIRCLAGENGSGKSTLIKVISGFYTFDKGTLKINGHDYSSITPNESMNQGIQVIYQDFALFPNLSIAENIAMYQTVREKQKTINRKRIRSTARRALEKIDFSIDLDKYVYQLTIAEKQMVAICRAIVLNAKLLIMDEPTTALTKSEVEKLFLVVRGLKSQGVSTLFVTHKLNEVYEICDCVTIMRNGRNVFESKKNDPIPSQEDMIFYMTGRKVEDKRYNYVPTGAEPIFSVENYTLPGSFENINFKIYPGEIVGITGLLGCGRSELAESLFGILPAKSGDAYFDSKNIGIIKDVSTAIGHGISYVPDDRLVKGLHLDHSVENNAVCRILGSIANRAGIFRKKKMAKFKKECLSSIAITGMVPRNPAKSLSGGNQQKLVLIKWLASNPRILILNCPTVGVDVGSKSEIHSIVKRLASERHIGVIVISDDIFEIMQICNRVYVMQEGRFAREMNIKDINYELLEDTIINNEKYIGASQNA